MKANWTDVLNSKLVEHVHLKNNITHALSNLAFTNAEMPL